MNPTEMTQSDLKKQLAEQRLMSSLLALHYEDEDITQQRVNNVMAKINAAKAERSRFTHFHYALAASFCGFFLCCWLVMWPPINSAHAEMDNVISYIENLKDRSYRISVTTKHATNQSVQASSLFKQGNLYLRGNEQFVLEEIKDNGRSQLKGSNGQQSWKVNQHGKAEIFSNPDKIKLPLAAKSANITFLDIASSLKLLRDNYSLNIVHEQALEDTEQLWSKLTLTKKDKMVKGVKQVVIYFDPLDSRLQRLIFNNVHLQGQNQRHKVTLDLLSSEPLPEKWFNANYHAHKF